MHHNYNNYNHYIVMFFIMIISGLLSTMNIWVDKAADIRFSMNDIYMTLLMTGWMFLFMALYYKEKIIFIIGLFLVVMIELRIIRNNEVDSLCNSLNCCSLIISVLYNISSQ